MTESTGRRRRTRAEARTETRAAILAAARRLFAERGYRGASLDEIADAAGFSKGAVYSNWPSKEALFLELLDTASAERPVDSLSTQPSGWALATLDFFLEAIRNPDTQRLLADRYREARRSVAPGLAQDRPDPDWATWEEAGDGGDGAGIRPDDPGCHRRGVGRSDARRPRHAASPGGPTVAAVPGMAPVVATEAALGCHVREPRSDAGGRAAQGVRRAALTGDRWSPWVSRSGRHRPRAGALPRACSSHPY